MIFESYKALTWLCPEGNPRSDKLSQAKNIIVSLFYGVTMLQLSCG